MAALPAAHAVRAGMRAALLAKHRARVSGAGSAGLGSVGGLSGVGSTARFPVRTHLSRYSTTRSGDDLSRIMAAQKVLEGVSAPNENKRQARQQVRDMLLWAVFLAMLTAALLATHADERRFFMTDGLRRRLNSIPSAAPGTPPLGGVTTVRELHAWLEGPLYTTLYDSSATFDGNELDEHRQQQPGQPHAAPGTALPVPGTVLGHGHIIGAIRVGQLRSQVVPCRTPAGLGGAAGPGADPWVCFADDATSVEEEELGHPNPILDLVWDPDEGREAAYESPRSNTRVGAPTVYTFLPGPAEGPEAAGVARAILLNLTRNAFIDLRTRALLVDFTVYNPSLDMVSVVRVAAELPLSGGVLTWEHVSTSRLFRDHRPADLVRLAAEWVVLAMVIYYTYAEAVAARRVGLVPYLLRGWRVIDVATLVLFYAEAVLRIASFVELPDLVTSPMPFVQFRESAHLLDTADDVAAVLALLSWLRILRFLRFVPQLQTLLDTLSSAAGRIGGYVFLVVVVLFASSQAFLIAFGGQVAAFRNLPQSLHALTRGLMGGIDFEALERAQPWLGPLLYWAFLVLVVLVMLNMFIAILSDSFVEVRERQALVEDFRVNTLAVEVVRAVREGIFQLPIVGPLVKKGMAGVEEAEAKYRDGVLAHRVMHDLVELSDANRDGTITAMEIAATLDMDDNGEVTVDEVKNALVAVGAASSTVDRLVEMLEIGPGGTVSTEALCSLLEDALGQARVDVDAIAEEEEIEEQFQATVPEEEDGAPPFRVSEKRAEDRTDVAGLGGSEGAGPAKQEPHAAHGVSDRAAKAAEGSELNAKAVRSLFRAVNKMRIDIARKRVEKAAEMQQKRAEASAAQVQPSRPLPVPRGRTSRYHHRRRNLSPGSPDAGPDSMTRHAHLASAIGSFVNAVKRKARLRRAGGAAFTARGPALGAGDWARRDIAHVLALQHGSFREEMGSRGVARASPSPMAASPMKWPPVDPLAAVVLDSSDDSDGGVGVQPKDTGSGASSTSARVPGQTSGTRDTPLLARVAKTERKLRSIDAKLDAIIAALG